MLLTLSAILTDGLVYAAYLFIVAIGLTLIFGVMKILNVTHGSFYAFGAYGAATAVGIYANSDLPAALGFLFMIALAMAIGLVMGLVLERGILRLVYGRDEVVVVLVTYAVFLILEDVIVLIWGPRSYAAYQPMVAAGNIELGELVLSNYDIVLVAIAVIFELLVLRGEVVGERFRHLGGRGEDQGQHDDEEPGRRGHRHQAPAREPHDRERRSGRGLRGRRRQLLRQSLGRRSGAEAGAEDGPQGLLALVQTAAGPAEVEVLQDLEVLRHGELPVHEKVEMMLRVMALHRSTFSWK